MKFGGMEMMSPKYQQKYCKTIYGTRNLNLLCPTYPPIIVHNLGSLGEAEILIDKAQRNKEGLGHQFVPLTVCVFPDHTATSLSYCLPNYQKGITLLNGFIRK